MASSSLKIHLSSNLSCHGRLGPVSCRYRTGWSFLFYNHHCMSRKRPQEFFPPGAHISVRHAPLPSTDPTDRSNKIRYAYLPVHVVAISAWQSSKQSLGEQIKSDPIEPAALSTNCVPMVGPPGISSDKSLGSPTGEDSGASLIDPAADTAAGQEEHILRLNCICNGRQTAGPAKTIRCVGCNLCQYMICMGLSDATLPDVYFCHICLPTSPIHRVTTAYLARGMSLFARREIARDIMNIAISPAMVYGWCGCSYAGSIGCSHREVRQRVAKGMAVVFDHIGVGNLATFHQRLLDAGNDNVTTADKIVKQAAVVSRRNSVSEIEANCLRNAFTRYEREMLQEWL